MGIDIKRKRELEEELCMANAKKVLSEDEKKELLAIIEADKKLKGRKKRTTIKEQLEADLDESL